MSTNQSNERLSRKSTVWTRDKISHLINLYHQNECLWNHYVPEYKSKEIRNKAIDNICNILHITKFAFGKKVHNLRNQFNSEMKKLEKRIEESGGNINDVNALKAHHCRWEHFEALMFLRKIIEPRPSPKRPRLQFDDGFKNVQSNNETKNENLASSDDILEYHLEESTEDIDGDFHTFESVEEEMVDIEREDHYDHKYNPTTSNKQVNRNNLLKRKSNSNTNSAATTTTTTKTFYTSLQKPSNNNTNSNNNNSSQATTQIHDLIHIEDNQPITSNSVIELSSNNREQNSVSTVLPVRDQWDIFGELIAYEFRLLNSDVSRKKLKRKIMQDLLTIGEEDDNS